MTAWAFLFLMFKLSISLSFNAVSYSIKLCSKCKTSLGNLVPLVNRLEGVSFHTLKAIDILPGIWHESMGSESDITVYTVYKVNIIDVHVA